MENVAERSQGVDAGQKTCQAIMKGQYHGLDITSVLCYIIK